MLLCLDTAQWVIVPLLNGFAQVKAGDAWGYIDHEGAEYWDSRFYGSAERAAGRTE